ncbi:hypothetical protein M0R45_025924 [Rubus argutus]|uniref:Uncharacterized protein n=1 Tax=Rubus argutus TaxID=59490 RepID=A0AAW1WXG4_RUBAR
MSLRAHEAWQRRIQAADGGLRMRWWCGWVEVAWVFGVAEGGLSTGSGLTAGISSSGAGLVRIGVGDEQHETQNHRSITFTIYYMELLCLHRSIPASSAVEPSYCTASPPSRAPSPAARVEAADAADEPAQPSCYQSAPLFTDAAPPPTSSPHSPSSPCYLEPAQPSSPASP